MNFFKMIFWASLLSALLWIVILCAIPAIIHEVEYRQDLARNKAKYMEWWHERDHNEFVTRREAE